MEYDQDKIDRAVFALLSLELHEVDECGGRAWKGFDWDLLSRLHGKGLIGNPKSKAKSVVLYTENVARCKAAFDELFARRA